MRHSPRVALAFATLVVAARAQQVPAPNPYSRSTPTPTVAPCGLVETTFGDPDWILATSDHILRASTCIFTSTICPGRETNWYDKIQQTPCYPDTKAWKFATETETGKGNAGAAFTMGTLGVGTFDGLYVKPGVSFTLYNGATQNSPYGGLRTGPLYATPTNWQNHACKPEFEPGTLFVPGAAGALSSYSIDFGKVEIRSIDLLEKDNEKEHDTAVYRKHIAFRRARTFKVQLVLSNAYSKGCYAIELSVEKFAKQAHVIAIPEVTGAIDPKKWGYKIANIEGKDKADRKVTLEVSVPPDAPVGRYEFKCKLKKQILTQYEAEKDFPQEVVILFNPWASTDDVYMATDSQRQEYVLATTGRIWRGSSTSMSVKPWSFDQFDRGGVTLDTTLDLLAVLTVAQRSDARLVARELSALVNSNDGSGVLTGRWDGNYSAGKAPGSWSGSLDILQQYSTSNTAVRYGQCWVFGGVLTSTMRTIGIPCRPLSNFSSAHDKNGDKVIERFYKAAGGLDRTKTKDSIWNYHVWCDAWIGAAWNAVDATPQEPSGGIFRLGPAPVSAVKANSGGNYDVDFVFAEVDADVQYKKDDGTGNFVLTRTSTTEVGKIISTKAVGANTRSDITSSYKAAPAPSEAILLPSGVRVELVGDRDLAIGQPLRWSVALENTTTTPRQVRVFIGGEARDYRGEYLGDLNTTAKTVSLGSMAKDSVVLPVTAAQLATWLPRTRSFASIAFAEVLTTTDVWVDELTTVVTSPPVTPIFAPAGPIRASETTTLQVRFPNPLAVAMTNTRVVFSVSGGLAFGDGSTQLTINRGSVAKGADVDATTQVVGVDAGTQTVTAMIESDQLSDLDGHAEIVVLPCPGFTQYGLNRNPGSLRGEGSTILGSQGVLVLENPQKANSIPLFMFSAKQLDLAIPPFGVFFVDLREGFVQGMPPFVNGASRLPFPIPSARDLIGVEVHFQGASIDIGGAEVFRLSNGLTVRICP